MYVDVFNRRLQNLILFRWRSNSLSKVPDQWLNQMASYKVLHKPAVQHMATYWSILEKMKGSQLRLTKIDDDILEHFQKAFPEFDPSETIDEDKMKSKEGKERWREFMMAYEKKIDDYNFGTMLRANPRFEYGEKETIFGRFYCETLQPTGH